MVQRRSVWACAAALLLTNSMLATDGYFQSGFGVIQQGRGGTGIALPEDTFAPAINPAGLAAIGSRFDFGVTLFRPVRGGSIGGNQLPPGYPNVNGDYSSSGLSNFYIPEIGFSHPLSDKLTFGVAVYGNGGMNTSYTTPIPLLGFTKAGVDLQQLFVSPAVSLKLNSRHSIGVALNLAGQQFHAVGLQNFASASYSLYPDRVTDRGYDTSVGAGFRVGWLGQVSRGLTFGATYQSRTYMGKFDKYKGLFADAGEFDIPANFGGGASLRLRRRAILALDVERILYSQVKSIANSGANQALLGAKNGPGFGWHDVNAVKTGIDVHAGSAVTLRAGYNHSGLAFSDKETFFNLLAPAVVQHHISGGATFQVGGGKEVSLAYVHAFGNTVYGVNSIGPAAGGGNANLSMHQDSLGLAFAWNRER